MRLSQAEHEQVRIAAGQDMLAMAKLLIHLRVRRLAEKPVARVNVQCGASYIAAKGHLCTPVV